jgi:glycerol-3-phosphate dehydrogenase (NAD(P)+)
MKIGILGAGAWGTAIAKLLAERDPTNDVWLWAYEPEVAEQIERDHVNRMYHDGFELPPNLRGTNSLKEAVTEANMVVSVAPSHAVRSVMTEAGAHIGTNVPIVSASKGIENETLMTMSEVLEDVLPIRLHGFLCYLSGPSFALEVSQGVPTAVVVAAFSEKLARFVQHEFATQSFRVYTSNDVFGVELGGALKNVIAIAAGAAVGMGLGYNSQTGMITRGLHEITRLAVTKGANPMTLMGLSGMGDLVLTCTGPLSRNRTVGELLGQGKTLHEILSGMKEVAEGVKTSKSVYHLAEKQNVEMPISEQVYQVLYEDKPARQALTDLMARDLKRELTL